MMTKIIRINFSVCIMAIISLAIILWVDNLLYNIDVPKRESDNEAFRMLFEWHIFMTKAKSKRSCV